MAVSEVPWEGHEEALRRRGMRADHMIEALGASNTERQLCVRAHSAKSAPGYYAYNGMLTSLSAQMCQDDDWERENPLSMPLLLNRKRKIALAVTSGDQYTGLRIPRHDPRSKNPKGELTRELARLNNLTNSPDGLFEPIKLPLQKLLSELEDFSFWFALVFFDKIAHEIRCEVSQPRGFNARGQVNDYHARIILPPYKLSDEDFSGDDDPNDGFEPVSFDVTRR